jgi:hypothetical protein
MSKKNNCSHNELMESFLEKDKHTGELTIRFYRCVDCGENVDARNVTTIPPSKGLRRIFAIND